jgi:ligand-binding sensor domain-containing protein
MKRHIFLPALLLGACCAAFSQGIRSIENIGFGEITILELAGNGDVWAGSEGHGLAFYRADSAKWLYYNHANTPQLPSDTITAININMVGGVQHAFIGTTQGATDISGTMATVITGLPQTEVKGIFYRPDSLWVLTTSKLVRYDSSVTHVIDYSPTQAPFRTTQRGISNCSGVWLATLNKGAVYTTNGTNFTTIDTFISNKKLVDNRVTSIAVEPNCNAKFIGTMGGFSMCPEGNNCRNFTVDSGLPQNAITSVAFACGKVWIGTLSQGIAVLNLPGNTFSYIDADSGLPDDSITSISANDQNCTVYVGSKSGDVVILDSTVHVVNILSGIEKARNESFATRVFPNPASSQVNFVFEYPIVSGQLVITDVNGRTLQSIDLQYKSNATVDVSQLQPGLYFYQVYSGNTLVKTGKVTVNH